MLVSNLYPRLYHFVDIHVCTILKVVNEKIQICLPNIGHFSDHICVTLQNSITFPEICYITRIQLYHIIGIELRYWNSVMEFNYITLLEFYFRGNLL